MLLPLAGSVDQSPPLPSGGHQESTERSEEGHVKRCFRCKAIKPISEFYAHPMMGDGHLGKCKEYNKKDVRENYRLRRDQYRAYYAAREHTEARKRYKLEAGKRRAKRHPEKARANRMVSNAVKSGKLIRLPCEKCGNPKSEAHHDDYSKPLDVRWLCFKHHREHHGQQVG